MKKTDFFRRWGAKDCLDMEVFDFWSDKREAKNLPWDVNDLDFKYDVNYMKKTINIQTPYGTDTYPLSDLYDTPNEEPQMLWHCNYWDGPLSGIARYKDKIVWFQSFEELDISNTRVFHLYKLSKKEIKEEIYKHNRWRKQGGRHCDYCDDFWDPNAKDISTISNIIHDWHAWFKKQPNRDYTKNKIVGTFDDIEFWKERERWRCGHDGEFL